ncbi:MAG: exodeoxyribonuclease III [Gammaproteobacteria bacterium]|nr:exodeoxyribonuclease III [Gammaproteobacteria bacterium]MYC98778.1 exodeoxyribonuclease III [Gammaproteobacteria bacterium]
MKIATWNVNSINARRERVLTWLRLHRPDVLCLQELKVMDDAFPLEAVEELGYHAAVYGQRTYNGVAILSRAPPRDIEVGMGSGDRDPQARLVAATVNGVRVLSAYVPNGARVGTDKYGYKLDWLRRLREHLEQTASPSEALVLAGDFNVAPRDRDVNQLEDWKDSVLCHYAARGALERIRDWGLCDVFERHNPEGSIYTWWAYQRLAFPRNNGLRIDHIYATESLAECSTDAFVDREARKKGPFSEKPSDHAPVVAEFDV